MKKVKMLMYNWHQVGSTTDRDGCGENYDSYTVGINGVKYIEENEPRNQTESWNYIIEFVDGKSVRVFNPNFVEYFKVN